MALNFLTSLIMAAVVYSSASLWGAEVSRVDALRAAGLTLLGGLGLSLFEPRLSLLLLVLLALLMVVAVVDSRNQVIPNRLVGIGLVWAVVEHLVTGAWRSSIIVGCVIFFFYLLIHVASHGGLGMGDVKFSLVLAFGLGYPAALISMVSGIWAAGIYALVVWVVHRNRRKTMALGPFLAFGGIIGILDLLH